MIIKIYLLNLNEKIEIFKINFIKFFNSDKFHWKPRFYRMPDSTNRSA